MTKESEQKNNIKWLYDLIEFSINKATNAVAKKFETSFYEKNKFNREVFFEKSSISLNKFEQQFYFDSNAITQESINYLSEFIDETILIGYELSEQTRNVLDRCNVTYIDIWLHPVRFMDDVYFAFKSNNKNINSILKDLEVNEDLFYVNAGRLKVQSYKGFRRIKDNVKDGSAVFIGQTLHDKAVCFNGKMLNLLDFKSEFEDLTKEYTNVIYSRHPFVKDGDSEVLGFALSFRNVKISDVNSYDLLRSDGVSKVVTISSSVATEAKYFRKESQFYYKPPVAIYSDDGYFTIDQEWLFPWFWAEILANLVDTNKTKKIRFESPKDKLRDALSFYWSYRNIDKLESFKQVFSKTNG